MSSIKDQGSVGIVLTPALECGPFVLHQGSLVLAALQTTGGKDSRRDSALQALHQIISN